MLIAVLAVIYKSSRRRPWTLRRILGVKIFDERLGLTMKRNFLAKAITLGLMLAVPLGVEAAHTLVENTTVNGETKINSEANSIIGNQHKYDYTINVRLVMNANAGYIKTNYKKSRRQR